VLYSRVILSKPMLSIKSYVWVSMIVDNRYLSVILCYLFLLSSVALSDTLGCCADWNCRNVNVYSCFLLIEMTFSILLTNIGNIAALYCA